MNTALAPALSLNYALNHSQPDWLLLVPAGHFTGRDGRQFSNPQPDAVIARFRKSGVPLPIDFEHASEIKAPKGERADAAGFIMALENRHGEVWGQVAWNAEGQRVIDAKSYKFYSPAFYHRKGEVLAMSSVGLTNKPNLDVPALNAQEPEDNDMPIPAAVCIALGLQAEASDDAVLTAINQLKDDKQTALNRAEQPPSPDAFMPLEKHNEILKVALNRAETAEQAEAERTKKDFENQRDALLEKIPPAERNDWMALCRQDSDLTTLEKVANSYAALSTPIVSNGKPATNSTAATVPDVPLPAGYAWEKGSDELHQKALNHMQQHQSTYEEAILSLGV